MAIVVQPHLRPAPRIQQIIAAALLALVLSATYGVRMASAEELVNALPDGVAMDGFDVVAYFEDGAPAKGSAAHVVRYKDKDWHFGTAENAAAFESDPAKYEPQFNGWCAYAVSEGYGAEVDFIKGWSVLDGKLYLNWNEDAKNEFVAEQEARKAAASENWPEVHQGLKDGSVELYYHKDEPSEGISHPQEL